jgi:hypothetical protein
MANVLLAIVSLILTVMMLTEEKIILTIKIAICCYLSMFVYSWIYSDFTLWWQESMFTNSNLEVYKNNHIFFKAIIMFVYNLVCLELLSKTLIIIIF